MWAVTEAGKKSTSPSYSFTFRSPRPRRRWAARRHPPRRRRRRGRSGTVAPIPVAWAGPARRPAARFAFSFSCLHCLATVTAACAVPARSRSPFPFGRIYAGQLGFEVTYSLVNGHPVPLAGPGDGPAVRAPDGVQTGVLAWAVGPAWQDRTRPSSPRRLAQRRDENGNVPRRSPHPLEVFPRVQ